MNEQSELYVFSVTDILKLLRGFETLNDYVNREKVIGTLKEVFLDAPNVYDKEFLEVVKEFNSRGMFLEDEQMVFKTRVHFEDQITFMDRDTILDYLDFYKSINLLY